MMQAYRDINFREASLKRISFCNAVIDEYGGQKLTLRQLYYQLVSRNIIANEEKSYKTLGKLVSEARIAGLIDWDAIEDRNRSPVIWSEYEGLEEYISGLKYGYRLPRWRGQENYVELWVEKAALAGVLEPLASKYHVTLMVNRGYSSTSSMRESAERFIEHCQVRDEEDEDERATRDLNPILFYLGDHDPSGEDMVRDIEVRMNTFGVPDIRVEKLALTTAQVRQFKPLPNPVKMKDSRAKAYIKEHGRTCWEVDALDPRQLTTIIERAFAEVTDLDKMKIIKTQEAKELKHLGALLPNFVTDVQAAVANDDSEAEETEE